MVGEMSVLSLSKVSALMSMVLPWLLLLLLLAAEAMMMRVLTMLGALELLPLLLSAELVSKMGAASILLLLLPLSRREAGGVGGVLEGLALGRANGEGGSFGVGEKAARLV